jgi:hypothetical protein
VKHWAWVLLAVAGCSAPSEEDIRRRFADYVAGANTCAQASECALATPGCPLGCFVAVRGDRKADVEKKANELIAEYQRAGRGCIYDCASPGPLACVAGRCSTMADAPDAGN